MNNCQYCQKYLFQENVFYYIEKYYDYKVKRIFCSKKCLVHFLIESLLYCDKIINDEIINNEFLHNEDNIDGEKMIIDK